MTFLPRYWSRQMTLSQITLVTSLISQKKTTTLPHYAKDSGRHSITQKRRATDPLASFLWSLNFMKETCTIKLMNTYKITLPPTYLGSEKVIVPNNV